MESLEEHTVGNYIKNYKNKGLDGLIMNRSPGVQRKLNSEQEKRLINVITNNTSDEVGFNSGKKLDDGIGQDWVLNNFKINIKHSSMGVILHRLNLSYTRPTYVLAKADKRNKKILKI